LSPTLRRWLIPDIAFILSVVTMAYCLFSFNGMQLLFRDADSGWHIRNGERVLATGSVPFTEPFSWSKPGGPWFAWEWLADCVMAEAHLWDGPRGVFFLYLIVLGIVTWLWFQLVWMEGTWFLVGAVSTWMMLNTTNIHWLARPHLFGWVFLLLVVLAAERAPQRIDWKHILLVGIGGALWANIHASFFLGAAIFFLYSVDRWLHSDASWKPLAIWGTTAFLASFLNPYGWHVHEHIIHYLGDKELISRIGEFQTFNFHLDGAEPLVVTLVVVAAGITLNLLEGRVARSILCLVLFVGALRSARGLPLLALVALPLALGAICRALESTKALSPKLTKWRDDFVAYNRNLTKLDISIGGWALAPLVLALFLFLIHTPLFSKPAGFSEDTFPVQISAQVEKLPADARIYSGDMFGGYMIYRFAGQRKVFFDGRSDYYGSAFMKDYLVILEAKPGWEKQWNRWNFTHALVPVDSALVDRLPLKGWREIAKDKTAILFEKGPQ